MREISQYIENEHRSTQNTSTTDKLIRDPGNQIRRATADEYLTNKIGSDSIECTGHIPERLWN